jgi:hypothetical protein
MRYVRRDKARPVSDAVIPFLAASELPPGVAGPSMYRKPLIMSMMSEMDAASPIVANVNPLRKSAKHTNIPPAGRLNPPEKKSHEGGGGAASATGTRKWRMVRSMFIDYALLLEVS